VVTCVWRIADLCRRSVIRHTQVALCSFLRLPASLPHGGSPPNGNPIFRSGEICRHSRSQLCEHRLAFECSFLDILPVCGEFLICVENRQFTHRLASASGSRHELKESRRFKSSLSATQSGGGSRINRNIRYLWLPRRTSGALNRHVSTSPLRDVGYFPPRSEKIASRLGGKTRSTAIMPLSSWSTR
jgi:hypothetical protein